VVAVAWLREGAMGELVRLAPGDRWLNTRKAAERIGYTARTLQKWRAEGRGPPFKRVHDHQARYLESALDEWMASCPDGKKVVRR
jgi:hypothetical protein